MQYRVVWPHPLPAGARSVLIGAPHDQMADKDRTDDVALLAIALH